MEYAERLKKAMHREIQPAHLPDRGSRQAVNVGKMGTLMLKQQKPHHRAKRELQPRGIRTLKICTKNHSDRDSVIYTRVDLCASSYYTGPFPLPRPKGSRLLQ